jgi:hypothetical protein
LIGPHDSNFAPSHSSEQTEVVELGLVFLYRVELERLATAMHLDVDLTTWRDLNAAQGIHDA